MPGLTEEEKRELTEMIGDLDLDELQRLFEERLAEQTEAHHGGNKLGRHRRHLALRPLGLPPRRHPRRRREPRPQRREGRRRAPLSRLSHRREGGRAPVRAGAAPPAPAESRNEGLADELDLDETVDETAEHAGRLSLVWHKSRKNAVKVLLAMDVGGSMHPYIRLCSQLFSAVNSQTHFKDLKTYYFHNCIYDWLYLDTDMTPTRRARPSRVVHDLAPRLQAHRRGRRRHGAERAAQPPTASSGGATRTRSRASSGCAGCGATSTTPCGSTPSPGPLGVGLRRRTIRKVRQVFPMYELSLDGLQAAVKKLMVAR